MGVVRLPIGFPHTFYVIAAPIRFLGMTAGIKMPRDPARTGPHDEGRSVLKDRSLPAWRETGQAFSTLERAALEWAEALTLISETHALEDIYQDIAAYLTEEEMVDLTIAIGPMNVFNRIAIESGCDLASS
jgi:hypothetical protein